MPIRIRPKAIGRGACVGIVSTSSPVSRDDVDRLTQYFVDRGHRVRQSPGVLGEWGYLAGSREQRAADLTQMFLDPEVSLVVPASGGKGASDLLDILDFSVIRDHPKVFVGLSDPSILCNAILAQTGMVTLHGPTGYDFFQPSVDSFTEDSFWRAVSGPIVGQEVVGATWNVQDPGNNDSICGEVIGGHLGTFCSLVGTRWMPETAGRILILEEIFASWAQIDAMLTHLRLAGVFDSIAALVFGVCVDCPRENGADDSLAALVRRCVGVTLPLVTNVEFGHTPRKIPLPIGGRIEIVLSGPTPRLRYLDDMVVI